jgi:hypothetical protein
MAERDNEVTRLAHDLGKVIRRTLAASSEVATCLERIKSSGYELSVVLEASVSLARADAEPRSRDAAGSASEAPVETPRSSGSKMTPLDKKFLRSLKISVDDDE